MSIACTISATVYIEADTEEEARSIVQKGGGWIPPGNVDPDKETIDDVEIQSVECTDDGESEKEEDNGG